MRKMDLPKWVVTSVTANDDFTLTVTFADNTNRLFDAKPLLEKPVYEKLKNPAFFKTADVECGTVVWNDDIDIAPEHLYEAGKHI